jgi:glycosyltransferase involved in cell wall biosynthesis
VSLPIVSIVTPSLNEEQYLEQAIQSVVGQNYQWIEYIVMDGGSIDKSVEIIQKHEADIDHWISEPDVGQSDAINRGWKQSKGDVLAWLNSDDAYLPGAISRVIEAFQKNPKVDIITSDCILIDKANNEIKDLPSTNFRVEALLTGN